MTANDTTDDDRKNRTVLENRRLGTRHVTLAAVDGAAVSVETPDLHTDETIGVAAYAYDDRDDGQVQLTLGSDVRVGVTLDASDARELADRIATAADEADVEL